MKVIELRGRIIPEQLLSATMSSSVALKGNLYMPIGYVDYAGTYEVIPKITEQILETQDKRMAKNVTIREIPFYEVGNSSGGNTIYIGNEV